MNRYPARRVVAIYGPEAELASWRSVAEREGHRLMDLVDEFGAPIMVAWITGPGQVQELLQLMRVVGVAGSVAPMELIDALVCH